MQVVGGRCDKQQRAIAIIMSARFGKRERGVASLGLKVTPDFVEQGACYRRSELTDLFFPRDAEGLDSDLMNPVAKGICDGCPVREECLDYALNNHEYGIWGGTNFGERVKIRRQRRKDAA